MLGRSAAGTVRRGRVAAERRAAIWSSRELPQLDDPRRRLDRRPRARGAGARSPAASRRSAPTRCDPTLDRARTVTVTRPLAVPGRPGLPDVDVVERRRAGTTSFSIARAAHAAPATPPYTVTIVPTARRRHAARPVARAARAAAAHRRSPLDDNTSRTRSTLGGADLADDRRHPDRRRRPAARRATASSRSAAGTRPSRRPRSRRVDVHDGDGALRADAVRRPRRHGRDRRAAVATSAAAPTLHLAERRRRRSRRTHDLAQPGELGNAHDRSTSRSPASTAAARSSPVGGARVIVDRHRRRAERRQTCDARDARRRRGHRRPRRRVTLTLLDGAAFASSYQLCDRAAGELDARRRVRPGRSGARATSRRDPARAARRAARRRRRRDGKPLGGVSVTARPSLRFLWTLDAAPQAFLAAIPAATAVTPETGELRRVGRSDLIADVWGHYDLEFEPPTRRRARVDRRRRTSRSRATDARRDVASRTSTLPERRVRPRPDRRSGSAQPVEAPSCELYLVSTDDSACAARSRTPRRLRRSPPSSRSATATSDDAGDVRPVCRPA